MNYSLQFIWVLPLLSSIFDIRQHCLVMKITGLGKSSGRGSELEVKSYNDNNVHIQQVESARAGDVYAFGILLLELLSGREASSQNALTLIDLVMKVS